MLDVEPRRNEHPTRLRRRRLRFEDMDGGWHNRFYISREISGPVCPSIGGGYFPGVDVDLPILAFLDANDLERAPLLAPKLFAL